MRTRVLRRPIVFLRFRCSILILLIKTVRCSILRFSIPLCTTWSSSINIAVRGRSQWPRGLSRGSAAARLLTLWVRIPPGSWMSVCCECCVLSGRGLCFGLITRSKESCRVWCVWVWSRSLDNEEALAHFGLLPHKIISMGLLATQNLRNNLCINRS